MADISNVSISVGDRFDTFDELADKIQQYSDGNYIQMWMRDARTVALVSSVGTQEFHERMYVLRKLAQGWQTGSTMTVTNVTDTVADDVQSEASDASASGDVVTDVVMSNTGGADIPHSSAVVTLLAHETVSVDDDIVDDPTDSSPVTATTAPPVQTTTIAGTCTSCITVLCLYVVLV